MVCPSSILPSFVPSALSASNVGTWRCLIGESFVVGDAIFGEVFGFTQRQIRTGVTFDQFEQRIHPADRALFSQKNERVRETGGVVVMELRVLPRPGSVRWVLIRGRYDRDERGCVGHGIAIDITDSKRRGDPKDGAYYATSDVSSSQSLTPLQTAVQTALALHQQIEALEGDMPSLRPLAELVLLQLGRELAKEVDPSEITIG
jgi:hypothetical protein